MGEVEARPRRGPQRPVRQEASSTNISPREEAEKVCHQAPHYLSHQLHQEARRGAQKNPQLSDVGDQGQDQGPTRLKEGNSRQAQHTSSASMVAIHCRAMGAKHHKVRKAFCTTQQGGQGIPWTPNHHRLQRNKQTLCFPDNLLKNRGGKRGTQEMSRRRQVN